MSLRGRVVLATAGAIVVAVSVLAIGVSVLVARHLHAALDGTLRDRAAEVARLSASAPALLAAPGALDARLGGEQLLIEVLDRRGRVVARSLSLGGALLPTRLVGRVVVRGRAVFADDALGGEPLRLYLAPLPEFGGSAAGGAVVVGATTADIAETLARLHLFALLSALAAAGLAGGAAFLLAQRALAPLERLAAGAAVVERTGDVRGRLPEPRGPHEVGRLAATLNRMLVALERAREGERRFLADASHELRTPVTALRGNVDYLHRHGWDDAVIEDLAADAQRLSTLTNDLLVLSREDAGEAVTARVRLDLLAREAGAGDPKIVVQASEPVLVCGDPAALERALANLVENARRYGPSGGRITISVERTDSLARLSVRDEGSGPVHEEVASVFERFWRGRYDVPGSGLGLAIVRATAQRHGGRVTVRGAEFTVELPALRELSRISGTPSGKTEKGSS